MKRKLLSMLFFMLTLSVTAWAQDRTVSGTVTGDDGAPLPGVTVLVKGTSAGGVTDINGSYKILVPEGGSTLVFSFVGYKPQEIEIGTQTMINAVLASDTQALEEVVVTGYFDQEKARSTSAIAKVSGKDIAQVPIADVGQLMQGRATGVLSTTGTGQPGAVAQIRVRGTGSISAGREPLYVVDGVIINNQDLSTFDNSAGTAASNRLNPLSAINPNDIESINILKDASATALYGSRGANGVVLITTKKGRKGAKATVSLNSQYGITDITDPGLFEPMTGAQLLAYDRELLTNSGFPEATVLGARPDALIEVPQTNWLDEGFRQGTTQSHDLSIRGGNESTTYFASASIFQQDGVVIGSNFQRFSSRLNLNHQLNDRAKVGMNVSISQADRNSASPGNQFNSPILGSYANVPWDNPRDENGNLVDGFNFTTFIQDNFVRSTALNPNNSVTFRTLGNVNASYEIIDGLTLESKLGIDVVNVDEYFYTDPTTPDGFDANGRLTQATSQNVTWTTQSLLKYTKVFGDRHSINALAGVEFQEFDRDAFTAAGTNFASGALRTLNSASVPESASGFGTGYAFLSYLSRVGYSLDGKYNVDLSFRRDGSSRFGTEQRYANFFSIGTNWLISGEDFFNVDFVDLLKVRASYGTTGNAEIGNFASLGLYGFNAAYNDNPAAVPTQIANPDLTWENSSTIDVGFEFGVLDNRISGSFDYYNRTSTDLLLNVPVPSTTGFTTQIQNIGEVKNTGVEVTINTENIRGDFSWTSQFQITSNNNEVVALANGQNEQLNGNQIIRVGEPIRSWYLREYSGADPATGVPTWLGEDGNAQTSYNAAPRNIVGNAEPAWFGSFTNTFSYKGIGLSALFYFVQGNDIYNGQGFILDGDGAFYGLNKAQGALQDYWKEPGDQTFRPQPLFGGNGNGSSSSTRYLEDGSYIRLRNITLSYDLPQNLIQKAGLGTARLYVQGTNVLTITDYTGFDPELAEAGDEFFRYPQGQSWTFGVNLTF